MLITTTTLLEGTPVQEYLGVVYCEQVIGANFLRDFMASVKDYFGGRVRGYEEVLHKAKQECIAELTAQAAKKGGNALIALHFDHVSLGRYGSILMVSASATVARI